ncbi:MAG: hypothetical protein MUF66_00220 [Gammaproteobacteria bacterium]|jgi:hypothetical protein|nr:hypothetical protein [Gammaproteobacteria bacterium]
MPYFVYRVHPSKRFELVERHAAFRDARDRAREMRAAMAEGDDYTVKVMFGKDPEEAERLMAEEREPRPLGEDA